MNNNLPPIAGIDVGKKFSQMAVLSPSNTIVAKAKIFHNASDSIHNAVDILKRIEKDFAAKPIVVMEATGHYHKTLFYSLNEAGFEVYIINPLQSNSIKNLNIRKVKNDKIDAVNIALLFRFQQLRPTNIPNEDLDSLRSLCRSYFNLVDELTAYKNRLLAIVDQLMLNFSDVFDNVCSKTALAVLENYPTPKHILHAKPEVLIELIRSTSRKNLQWATKKYELLISKAKDFEPLSISTQTNIIMLATYISIIKTLNLSLEKVLLEIKELLNADALKDTPVLSPLISLLCTIPGIGLITAATILAEIRDITAFSKPNKLVAFCGLDPSVKESGQFKGSKNSMSKRGHKLLRKVLFIVALANIRKTSNGNKCNPVLYDYYHKKCASKPKMVALGAVMRKLVLIIYAVLRDKRPFELRNPEEHAKSLDKSAA